MELVKFINTHKNWEELLKQSPYNLIIQKYEGLILFKYVQFSSHFSEKIVQESRGVILAADTFDVVCRPFNKFFNYGESEAYDINYSNASIVEKLDGSIIKVYYDSVNYIWRVATNGTIDASLADTCIEGITFRDLFNDAIQNRFDEFTAHLDVDQTYLFELIHPISRVVVDYGNLKQLVFIGMRSTLNGTDWNIFSEFVTTLYERKFSDFGIRWPKIYNTVKEINELSEYADELNETGTTFEGFVVTEFNGLFVNGRVKIKSPEYLKFHRLTGGKGVSVNMIQILLDGETEEFEIYMDRLPAYITDEYRNLRNLYNEFVSSVTQTVNHFLTIRNDFTGSESDIRKLIAIELQTDYPRWMLGFVMNSVFGGKDVNNIIQDFGAKKLYNILTSMG